MATELLNLVLRGKNVRLIKHSNWSFMTYISLFLVDAEKFRCETLQHDLEEHSINHETEVKRLVETHLVETKKLEHALKEEHERKIEQSERRILVLHVCYEKE